VAAGCGPKADRPGPPARPQRAFTLVDLVIAVFVILIVAAVALPSMRPDERGRLLGAASRVVSDLEYARSLSIGKPDDPAAFVLEEEGLGYWIALAETPETPIAKNGLNEPYEILFGEGDADVLHGVTIALIGEDEGGTVAFDVFGRLNPAVAAEIVLTNEAGTLSILVDPWTGDAEIQAIEPPDEE
jgi:hypothetical protein